MSNEPRWVEDHWEVDDGLRYDDSIPAPYQKMNNAERQRIIATRWAYLDFMHDHFADRVVEPPQGVTEVETTHSHG
ncbi:MAG: hypothetical protein FWH11_06735 [Micrococcales bacterium]|nr:hypothetical protein [Micrococcales bacterium]